MDGRPQTIDVQSASMKPYSGFVKVLHSLYARSSHFLRQILAQVERKGNKQEKDSPPAISKQTGASITNKGDKLRTKKPKPISDPNVKQKAK